MSSRVITFRLDTESEPGKVFIKWEEKGYETRQIIESALMIAEGVEPPQVLDMGDSVIDELRRLVDRLEGIARVLQSDSANLTNDQQQVIDDVLSSKFVEGMRKIARPGFSKRPDDEA